MSIAADLPAGSDLSGVARRLKWINSGIDRLQVEVEGPALATRADIAGIDRAMRRLEAAKLALVAKADRQRVHTRTGDASTSAFLAGATASGGAAASGQVALATALSELPATRVALAGGEVSTAGATIIASAVRGLPEDLTQAERDQVESSLVREAKRLDPARLRKAATLAVAAAGRNAQEAAEHQEQVLTDRERSAYAASMLTLHDNEDGTTTGRFTVPTLAAHILKKVVDSMSAPRRDHLRSAPSDPVDGDSDDSAGARLRARDADWAQLDWAQKRGRALVAVLEHLPTEALTGRVASSVVVTMTVEQVLGAARAATLFRDTGASHTKTGASHTNTGGSHAKTGANRTKTGASQTESGSSQAGDGCASSVRAVGVGATRTDTSAQLSTSEARRIACNAGILPAVLGGASIPLDLGRERRLFSESQRTALASVHDECAAVGCDRPMAWCELHHAQPWSRGGRTDLRDAVPLCGWHHRHLHDPQVHHRIERSPTGLPVVRFTQRT